jgi:DNA-binding GntR family transcriptional regulator
LDTGYADRSRTDEGTPPVPGITPIDRPSRLVYQVTERLREMILDGSLAPGTELRQESLSADFGVSRTPLREAFRVLERDGLIQSISNNRSVVVELDDENMRELLEIREALDGLAARLAAERTLDAPQAADLRDAVESLEASGATMDLGTFLSSHVRFHTSVFEAAGNSRLDMFLPIVRISTQMWFTRLRSQPERVQISAHEHREIVDAILAGDTGEAERLARSHIQESLKAWTSSAEPEDTE